MAQQSTVLSSLFALRNEERKTNKVEEPQEKPAVTSIEAQAERLMDSGLTEEETLSALVNLGFKNREARAALGLEVETVKKEKPMGRGPTTDSTTISEIRRLAKEGKNPQQISEALSVSWPTAKKYSEAQGGGKTIAKLKTKSNGHAVPNGACSMNLTPQLADAIWATLPIATKANLLQRLE